MAIFKVQVAHTRQFTYAIETNLTAEKLQEEIEKFREAPIDSESDLYTEFTAHIDNSDLDTKVVTVTG